MRCALRAVSAACAAATVLAGLSFSSPAAAAGEDSTAPAVTSVRVEPAVVDASRGAVPVVVVARLTDTGTGVARALVHVGDDVTPVSLTRLKGTARDGEWTGLAQVPARAAAGPASVTVTLTDQAGNAGSHAAAGAVQVSDAVPSAPSQVAAAGEATGSVRATWTAPHGNGGTPVTGYTVTAVPAPGSDPSAASGSVSLGDAHEATLAGLTPAVRYVVTVAARNAAGTGAPARTDATTGSTAPTSPGAPLSAEAVPGPARLTVSWTPPAASSAPVTGYQVAVPGREPVQVPFDTTTAQLSPLANGKAHDVTVRALTDQPEPGLPAQTSGTPRDVPGAPVMGTASAGDATVVARWSAPASNGSPVHAYVVRATPSGREHVVPASWAAATLGGMANGTAATLTVKALNAAGAGPWSAARTVTPRLRGTIAITSQPVGTVVYGRATVVRADLRTAGNQSVSGRVVELMAQPRPGKTWRRVASARTDSTGLVQLRAVLPATSALRLRHPNDVVTAPDVAVRTVYVRTRVTAALSTSRVRTGRTITVQGSVAPAHPKGSAMRLQRYTSDGWVTLANGAMTSTTAYRITWRTAAVGSYRVRVIRFRDAHHSTGISPQLSARVDPENSLDVARAIRSMSRITLATVHVSGVRDSATAKQNIEDVAAGRLARRSSYGRAPGGSTALDVRVLKAIRRMGQLGTVTISEIAGGSHASRSGHYSGRAVDITYVNGTHVRPGSSYGMAVNACRAYGASSIYTPANDPYGGHQNHVHCGWG